MTNIREIPRTVSSSIVLLVNVRISSASSEFAGKICKVVQNSQGSVEFVFIAVIATLQLPRGTVTLPERKSFYNEYKRDS